MKFPNIHPSSLVPCTDRHERKPQDLKVGVGVLTLDTAKDSLQLGKLEASEANVHKNWLFIVFKEDVSVTLDANCKVLLADGSEKRAKDLEEGQELWALSAGTLEVDSTSKSGKQASGITLEVETDSKYLVVDDIVIVGE